MVDDNTTLVKTEATVLNRWESGRHEEIRTATTTTNHYYALFFIPLLAETPELNAKPAIAQSNLLYIRSA